MTPTTPTLPAGAAAQALERARIAEGQFDQGGILRGLTHLPLIGGSVAIIGNPTAVDVEPTQVLLESYSAWLNFELRYLNATLLPRTATGGVSLAIPMDNDGARFHRVPLTDDGPADSAHRFGRAARRRAALVLSAVGCGWEGVPTFEPL